MSWVKAQKARVSAHVHVVRLQLQLSGVQNRGRDTVGVHSQLQRLDGLGVQLDLRQGRSTRKPQPERTRASRTLTKHMPGLSFCVISSTI